MIKNSKGKIYYGMHFYPGVAEYAEAGKEPYRIFLNESTIRKMDPTFAGKPIYVEHVDEVSKDLNELRKEADGWVVESFFNEADGKHWVKFIVVSDKAELAIKNGFRLSNAYIPSGFGAGGLWNGVSYQKEVTGGEFEHLAIVRNPRYEESEIMSPEKFKQYNENLQIELKRLANSKSKEGKKMGKFSFFKREKVENEIDLEEMSVTLPKSGKEKTLVQLVNEADERESSDGMVVVGKTKMKPEELAKKYLALQNKMDEMKKENEEDEDEDKKKKNKEDDESLDDMVDKKKKKENEEDQDMEYEKKKNKKKMNKEDEEDDEDQDMEYAKKKNKKKNEDDDDEMEMNEKKKNKKKNSADEIEVARAKYFDLLKNASSNVSEDVATVETLDDRVALGKSRYGSK